MLNIYPQERSILSRTETRRNVAIREYYTPTFVRAREYANEANSVE